MVPPSISTLNPSPSVYDYADLYDLIVTPGPCERFYRDLACDLRVRALDRRTCVLELGCGTGRLTLPLAADGHDVTGLDAAPAMLARARHKAQARGVTVRFVQGDMRAFDLAAKFSLIVVGCNSLAHLTDTAHLRACFRAVRAHLDPNGIFAFDVVNPDVGALGRDASRRVRLDIGPNPSSSLAVEEEAAYDPIQQVRTHRWRVRDPRSPIRGDIAPLHLRVIFPQELPLLLESEGLEIVARFGDFARNPLTAESLNQICLVKAR